MKSGAAETFYTREEIEQLRKKYKGLIWLRRILYLACFLLILFLSLDLILLLPDNLGFFDMHNNYYYFYDMQYFFFWFIVIVAQTSIYLIVKYAVKRKLGEEGYIEYLVAEKKRNVILFQHEGILKKILLPVIIIVIFVMKVSSIKVDDSGFSVRENIFKNTRYSFDILDRHKIVSFSSYEMAFCETNGEHPSTYLFSMGKYSPAFLELLKAMDEKTDYKYNLNEAWSDWGSIMEEKY